MLVSLMEQLGCRAGEALRALGGDGAPLLVEPGSHPDFGDLQVAGCLKLARALNRAPHDLAQVVADALRACEGVGTTEVAPPGYVNIRLRDDWIEEQLAAMAESPFLNLRQGSHDYNVVIDYSSPNIAKPLHVGHLRSTVIGECLVHVMKASGYNTTGVNHLGDWGLQFGKLLCAYKRWGDGADISVENLERLYQRFSLEESREQHALDKARERAGQGGEQPTAPLTAEARAELAKLHAGDEENLRLWRVFLHHSCQSLYRTYRRLDVCPNMMMGESYYHGRLPALVRDLLARGIAEHSQGAVVCPVPGEPAPLIVRKSDGSFLYGTTDIAALLYRAEEWRAHRVLYVVGAPQALHLRQVFHVAKRLGIRAHLEHVSFGSVLRKNDEGRWVPFSTRGGNTVPLESLLEEAEGRVRALLHNRGVEQDDEVVSRVGLGAVKWNDLCRDREADVRFDLDAALSLDGNTAAYVQYAAVRLGSILRGLPDDKSSFHDPDAGHASRALKLALLRYGSVVEKVAADCRPHHLCEYLNDLASRVSHYYHKVQVLGSPPDVRSARVRLCRLASRTLGHGLKLLGIQVPDRM